ncbi:UNVERIFIED_CONTAM: DNA repair exonuclease [Spiribacter pallidus]|mgnify:FL=1|jgi:DNA repair exonuclease SbcCD nuclease subunit|uniref:exonuclease SbcCD subunit D n=1 Tax=Spiribacter pallidus TaxID=1987936 RepID=UPI0034A03E7A
MTIKLLAAGDLHLGRRPGRLPDAVSGHAIDYAPAEAWQRLIDCAIGEAVDAVILAGDVVESSRDYFEALPRLQRGIQQLTAAGIRICLVSGNHDVEVLPRLIQRVPDAELLGAEGEWQAVEVYDRARSDSVVLWGWSFPQPRVERSPLVDFPGARPGRLNVGVLHCDRDQLQSPYAPVSGQALADSGVDVWLLGHIHQPDSLSATSPYGYLGTVCGLDAGDQGPRGPWRIDVTNGEISRFEQRALAPIQWTPLRVDLTGTDSVDGIEGRLLTAFEKALGTAPEQAARAPDLYALQVTLTGESDYTDGDVAAALPNRDQVHECPAGYAGQWFLERWTLETQPTIALSQLARRDDQPGLLARRLEILARPATDPERQSILQSAARVANDAQRQGQWQRLPGQVPDAETIAEWLQQRGLAALRAMLAAERD